MTRQAYDLAEKDLGTWEWKDGHNPKVVQYFHDVGHAWVKDDETAWCAAFVGAILKRAGMPHTGKLNARSYLHWGDPISIDQAQLGDIVVFWRGTPSGWQGHVGFYEDHDDNEVMVLGGNQSDQVNVKTYPRDRLLGVQRSSGAVDPQPVAVSKERKSVAESKTVRASVATAAGGAGTAMGAISGLDSVAQYIVLGFAGLVVLGALFILRERLKAWSEGWR